MFKFCNLYSGSSGNCSFIETDSAKILIDCGTSSKKVQDALNSIGYTFDDIDAIIITHEHSDHIKGLGTTCKKFDIPVYANEKTYNEISKNFDIKTHKNFKNGENFEINDLTISPFSIPHDAADPCGFNLYYKSKKVSIATDLGHIENSILKRLDGSDFLLLESNYEPDILKCSKYPYMLKKRILGPNGHLSNEDASNIICTLAKSGLNNVTLGHLSKENNFPELAYKTTMNDIISNNFNINNFKLDVANRDKPNKLFDI